MPVKPAFLVAPSGYRASTLNPGLFARGSRDFALHGDIPIRRPGFSIRRALSGTTASFLQRLPVDQSDGTLRVAFQHQGTIYEDSASPTSRDATLTDPYGATGNRLPSTVYALGSLWYCNGVDADWRRILYVGGQVKCKPPLADPGTPTLAAAAGGAMTAATWYVRIRWYDEDTGTYSGPSARTGSAGTAVTSGGNLKVRVTRPTPPARATHWQVQLATTDSPDSYQIHYDPEDSGGTDVWDVDFSTGLIPVATTDAYFDVDPTSGVAFESRSGVYRHTNPPTGASFSAHYMGRLFYAAYNDTWLAWTETDNLEYFYTDNTSPHAGLNTIDGESLVDTVLSPCMALAATEMQLLFITRSGIVIGEGSWELIGGERQARIRPLTQNTLGSITPATLVVDQDVYLLNDSGPKIYTGGGVLDLDTEAIREDWMNRDPVYDHRAVIGRDPERGLILFAFVPKDSPIAGVPTKVLVWSESKRVWCPPWNLAVTSFTLHRFATDAGTSRGVRLMFGGPYGCMNEWGYGDSDGGPDSDTDTRSGLVVSSYTSTTVTVSGKAWSTNQHKGRSVVLVDRTTGRSWLRWVKSNTADTITFEGSATNSGGGWIAYIGGIAGRWVLPLAVPGGNEFSLHRCAVVLRDTFSSIGTQA